MLSELLQREKGHLSQVALANIIAALVGVLCGLSACVLKYCINFVAKLVMEYLHAGFHWPLVVLPIIGIVLTVAVCKYILGYSPAHGTKKVEDALKEGNLKMRRSLMYSSVLTGSITLGFGGSAGGEGPIAYTGAAIGSNIAQRLGLGPDLMRVMVGCGAGAGIAGIFKAPFAGALYSIEVLHIELTNPAILALFLAVVVASLTAYVMSGFTFDILMDQSVPFDWHWLGWIALLGIICGLYSRYYEFSMAWLARLLAKIGNIWVRAVTSGCIISACVVLCPALFGEGYDVIGHIINSDIDRVLSGSVLNSLHGAWALISLAALTMLLKAFACSATNNGGGVAGTFAPTLFAGCFVGLFYALTVNALFDAHLIVGHFAFFGMAGAMGGIIGAPLMAIFLVCEMSGSFGYFLPVAICVAISMGMKRLCTPSKPQTTPTAR